MYNRRCNLEKDNKTNCRHFRVIVSIQTRSVGQEVGEIANFKNNAAADNRSPPSPFQGSISPLLSDGIAARMTSPSKTSAALQGLATMHLEIRLSSPAKSFRLFSYGIRHSPAARRVPYLQCLTRGVVSGEEVGVGCISPP